MKNLLLLLLLANILYLMWGMFGPEAQQSGIVIVQETDLGPPLSVAQQRAGQLVASVGAVLGSGEPSALEAVVGRSCATIGPFRASDDAEAAQKGYADAGMRTALRSNMGQIFIGHWVYIEGIPDRETGNQMIEKLHAGGLTDAYLAPSDDGGRLISLGLFGSMEGAERVELQAKSMDLPATIAARTQDGMVYFVDIGLPPGKGAGAMIDRFGEDKVLLRDAATCPQDE